MTEDLHQLLGRQGGVVTYRQALASLGRRRLRTAVKHRLLHQVWHGVYGRDPINTARQLRGLDLLTGTTVAACLSTAAAVHGFDTEEHPDLHVLSPPGMQLRPAAGLVVHRRDGAPLVTVAGRPVTAPAWTAVEVARGLGRPRALATLDLALRSGTCSRGELESAVGSQAGRRGIVTVRELLPLADPLAESPMESESRLMMIDGGLPPPVLQHEVADRCGKAWRVDFAWPELRVAVEYDGLDWHSGPAAFVYDRQRRAALQEVGWVVIALIADDVRRRPGQTVRRIAVQLAQSA